MNVGWQELVVVGSVGFAVYLLARRLGGSSSGTAGCGGRCAGGAPRHAVKITELHTIDIEPRLPEIVVDGDRPPANGDQV